MDVTALDATILPRPGRAKMKLNVHRSHTGEEPKSQKRGLRQRLQYPQGEGTNRNDWGIATVCRLCLETRTLGTHRRDKTRTSGANWMLQKTSCKEGLAPHILGDQRPGLTRRRTFLLSLTPAKSRRHLLGHRLTFHVMPFTIRAIAPFSPTVSKNICSTGKPVGDATVFV